MYCDSKSGAIGPLEKKGLFLFSYLISQKMNRNLLETSHFVPLQL